MKTSIILKIVLIIAVLIIGFYGVNWMVRFMEIDDCLDRGGRWNYELEKCDEFSMTEWEMYVINKEKSFNSFKNFHIWQRSEGYIFDYYNENVEKRYLICDFEDTLFYKIIFSDSAEFEELDLIGNNEYISTELYLEFKNLKIDKLTYDLKYDVFFLKKDGYCLIRSEKSLDTIKRYENYSAIDKIWYRFVDSSDNSIK